MSVYQEFQIIYNIDRTYLNSVALILHVHICKMTSVSADLFAEAICLPYFDV